MSADETEELPEGWARAIVSEVTEVVTNIKPEEEPKREFAYVDISAIDNRTNRLASTKAILGKDAPSRARRPVRAGDVLFSNVRTYLRNVAIVPEGIRADLCSTGITVLRPNEAVVQHFLFRYTLTDRFVQLTEETQTGTHYPATSDRAVLALPIAVPPLAEQRRIVAAIEAVLARVGAARYRLDGVPGTFKRFRQAVLTAACSGRLTEDWRVANPGQTNWNEAKLGDVCEIIGGSQPAKDRFVYQPREGFVRLIQIRDYKSDDHLTFVPKALARRFCSARDVMIGRYGPPLFQILRGLEGAYNVALMKAVPRDESQLDNEFLFRLLQNPTLRNDVIQFSERTVGQDGVRKDLLEEYPVQIPPLPEQREIVRRVDALFALADRIGAKLTAAQQRVERLTQAVLAKAFRGDLVPTEAELARREGRTYEPASALLERIRAERAATGEVGKPGRRAKAISPTTHRRK